MFVLVAASSVKWILHQVGSTISALNLTDDGHLGSFFGDYSLQEWETDHSDWAVWSTNASQTKKATRRDWSIGWNPKLNGLFTIQRDREAHRLLPGNEAPVLRRHASEELIGRTPALLPKSKDPVSNWLWLSWVTVATGLACGQCDWDQLLMINAGLRMWHHLGRFWGGKHRAGKHFPRPTFKYWSVKYLNNKKRRELTR